MTSPKLYNIIKLSLRYLIDNNYNVSIDNIENSKFVIAQGDNQLFRQIRIITHDSSNFNRWIVFVDCKSVSNKEEPINQIIYNGFYINGTKYELSERSASMTRNSILSFADSSIVEELNERVTMGVDVGKTVLSKWYAYRGLSLSSCHCIEDWYPKVIVVKDLVVTRKDVRVRCLYDKDTEYTDDNGVVHPWTQKDVTEKEIDLEINLFDGCGMHHPDITKYVKERLRVKENPTSLLIRMPFVKGVTHELDYVSFYEERGITSIVDLWGHEHSVTRDAEPMFILTESQYKGYKYFNKNKDYSDWEKYWDMFRKYNHCIGITKWNFSKEREPVYTRANYQILQDLKLPFDEFSTLANNTINWATDILSGDRLSTLCFFGMTADKDTTLNYYCKSVLKNPEMLKEQCVKKYIRKSISKYLEEMKCGKIYIKGCFKFLAPDLVMMMEHIGGLDPVGCLESNEFYSHNIHGDMIGEFAIERNPHICSSEHVVLNGVVNDKTKWFEHLDNVAVVNSKGIVAQRIQGADNDGDLVLVIDNKTVINGIERDACPVIDIDDKITVEPEEDSKENRSKIVLRTMKNMIGEFSNYSSAYHNKVAKSEDVAKKYEKYVDIIAVATGKSIDFAKTGVLYNIPRHIAKYGRPLPYFMKYRGNYYARQKLSKTKSNMNKLCYALEKWDRNTRWARSTEKFDYTIMIDDSHKYTQDQFDKIKIIYDKFYADSKSMSKFQYMCNNYDKYSDSYMLDGIDRADAIGFVVDWNYYFKQAKLECKSVCSDECALANIVVRICYETYPKRDKNFIWAVAENGLLSNIKQVKHKLPHRVFEESSNVYLGKYYEWIDYDGSDCVD